MGQTLNTAAEMDAYVLSDKATWLSFKNRGDLAILVSGDSRLHNPYSAILVSKEKHPHVKAKAGEAFIRWLRSPDGQRAIGSLERDGTQLFTPNAN